MAIISDKERVKERWAEHFENVPSRDRCTGKDIEENEKVCDTLDMKQDLFFFFGRISDSNKRIKNNKNPRADCEVNGFLKYGDSVVRK